jgi:hypothetical protein
MSEIVETGAELPVSDEANVIAMLGLEDDHDTASVSDAEDAAQPDEGEAPEESAQPDDDAGAEPQETAPIDPPAFWTSEAKEHWQNIPPETQSYLVERERQRDTEVRRSQNDAATARQEAERVAAEIAQERVYLTQHLAPVLQELSRQLQDGYSTEAMAELARTNPAQWAEKVAERDRKMEMHQRLMAEHNRTQQIAVAGEMTRLAEKAPELRDPQKAAAFRDAVVSVAGEYGFAPQEVGAVTDHRALLVLRDLANARAELAALKAAKQAPAQKKAVQPVVSRPASANRPRPDATQGALSRRDILNAARSGDQNRQIDAVTRMLGL